MHLALPSIDSLPWISGATVALAVGVTGRRRLIVASGLLVPLALGVAPLLHPRPVLGGLLFGLVAALSGLSVRAGFENQVRMGPIVVAIALCSSPTPAEGSSLPAFALLCGASAGLAFCWTLVLVVGPVMRRVPPIEPSASRSRWRTGAFALVAGAACGLLAWRVLSLPTPGTAAWLLVTVVAVVQPETGSEAARTAQRIGGTVIGVAAAAVLGIVATGPVAAIVLTTLLLVTAVHLLTVVRSPYWVGVAVLTPAVVLLQSSQGQVWQVALERLGWTLLGAALAVVLTVVIGLLSRPAASTPE